MTLPNRQKVSFKLTLDSTYLVEIAFPEELKTIAAPPAPPRLHAEVGRYRLRLAETAEDREAAEREALAKCTVPEAEIESIILLEGDEGPDD